MMDSSLFLLEAFVRALGWTLVHALWQGTAIALLLWATLPRERSARRRYWMAYGGLLSLAGLAAATFFWVYEPSRAVETASVPHIEAPLELLDSVSSASANTWATVAETLEAWHPMIVALWLPGFLFFLLRLAGGLHYLHRLCTHRTQPLADDWQARLQALTAQIGYARPVRLLESALIQVPMTLGYFKPLILLPIGLTNHLSPAEVEAVLAHELAHIARQDWLFNLLQTLIEAVFYFHPAVWWMSATIRAERENCCDDTAVALTGNRLAYAKTLARLQEMARPLPTPTLALGLNGATPLLRRRPLLLERIQRLLLPPPQHTTAMEKTIALVLLAALAALFTLRAHTPPALTEALLEIVETPKNWLQPTVPPETAAWQMPADTVPATKKERGRILHDDGTQSVEIETEAGKMSRLVIDGQEIPPADFGKYSELTEKILREATPPPTPPAPPMPAWAPKPPAAPRAWDAPAPPAPPSPGTPVAPYPPRGSASVITTDVDGEGNTVIRFEQNGAPTEIRVRDGEVWVDGKRLEKGERLDIPGAISITPDLYSGRLEGSRLRTTHPDGRVFDLHITPTPDVPAPYFHFRTDPFYVETPEGTSLHIHEGFPTIDAHRVREEALRELERQHRQIERELREVERLKRAELGQAQKEVRKAQEEARRELDRQRIALEKERAALEVAKAREHRANAEQQARFNARYAVFGYLEQNLLHDNLIADPNNFTMELSTKALRVNDKKQPDATHKRYLELYQSRYGQPLDNKQKLVIEMKAGARSFGWR